MRSSQRYPSNNRKSVVEGPTRDARAGTPPPGELQIEMDYSELRRHPRVTVDFFADWGRSLDCEYYDKVTSLSVSGCFLATRRELNPGDEIYLRLREEVAGAINVKGAVRYQLRVMEGAPPTGAGIEFVGLSSDSQRRLEMVMKGYRI